MARTEAGTTSSCTARGFSYAHITKGARVGLLHRERWLVVATLSQKRECEMSACDADIYLMMLHYFLQPSQHDNTKTAARDDHGLSYSRCLFPNEHVAAGTGPAF